MDRKVLHGLRCIGFRVKGFLGICRRVVPVWEGLGSNLAF